jgi:transposase-like protein
MDRKNPANAQVLIQLIDRHTESVKRGTITCATTVCCHCGLDVADRHTRFAFHGTRARRFLVLIGSYVCKVAALLTRWRCPHCHRTFTDYPPFACPRKAYTLPQMTERAAKYVNIVATSYRREVRSENLPIVYENGPTDASVMPGDTGEVPRLSHTSLFRWVTTFGDRARQQPETVPADFRPASHKYTSEERRTVLIVCRAICSVLLPDQAPAALPC